MCGLPRLTLLKGAVLVSTTALQICCANTVWQVALVPRAEASNLVIGGIMTHDILNEAREDAGSAVSA